MRMKPFAIECFMISEIWLQKYFLKKFGMNEKIISSLHCKTKFKTTKHATHTITYRSDKLV